jgi:hypothetical protein
MSGSDHRARRSLVAGLVLAASLAVINLLAIRADVRPIDLTSDRAFTLDPTSRALLKRLDRPLRITLFVGADPTARGLRRRVRSLLDLYREERPARAILDEVSLTADPTSFEAFARRVPEIAIVAPSGGVAFEIDTRRAIVPLEDLIGPPDPEGRRDGDGPTASFRGEDALTAALARLMAGATLRVAFTIGHGERSSDSLDDPNACGRLRARLRAFGAESVTWGPRVEGPPDGLDAALIVAPRARWDDRARARLREWLDDGGRAVLILDGSTTTGLEADLAARGVTIAGPGPILDPLLNLRGRPEWPLAPIPARETHPIAGPLASQGVLIPSAVPLALTNTAASRVTPVLRTGRNARVEGPETAVGPFVVAAAVTRIDASGATASASAPSLVVISSGAFADNATAAESPGNLDLIVNAVGWLRDRPTLLGLAPRGSIAGRLVLDPNLKARLVLVPTIGAVTAIVAAGLLMYLARRS